MKVAVAVHGRFHGFDLARGLHERGCLSQVATTYPAIVARRFLPRPIRLRTAPWLEAWRRLHGRVTLPCQEQLCPGQSWKTLGKESPAA